jgi:hypothetical protein
MSYNFGVARPAKEWQMPPRPRRRAKASRAVDLEKIERDFWQVFDLEKFARDWRRAFSKSTA